MTGTSGVKRTAWVSVLLPAMRRMRLCSGLVRTNHRVPGDESASQLNVPSGSALKRALTV